MTAQRFNTPSRETLSKTRIRGFVALVRRSRHEFPEEPPSSARRGSRSPPLVVFGIYLAFKKGIEKLKESGHWDRFLEKLPEPNSSSFGASSGRSSDSRKRAT